MNRTQAPRLAQHEDPLDLQMHRLGAAPARVRALPWHVRLGISWSSGAAPVILLLMIGAALGPGALAILTPGVLSAIDPAVPVALAALGAHVGLNLPWSRSPHQMRLVAGASVEAIVTALIVGGGILLLLSPDPRSATFHVWLVALASGISASMSASLPDGETGPNTPGARLQQFDVILPTILGAVVLAWVREGAWVDALLILAHATALALVVAVAAWLLLARTTSDTEQRIFGVSSLLLVGGLADYLSLSALWSGLVAGTFWRIAGGPAAESIRRDVGYLQHPLVVLLLVVAGARMGSSALPVVAAYLLLRTVGKLLGGWIVRRTMPDGLPDDLGLLLVSPGIFGVAFAMNTVRAAGPQTDPLLGIVILGAIGSQLIFALRRPVESRA